MDQAPTTVVRSGIGAGTAHPAPCDPVYPVPMGSSRTAGVCALLVAAVISAFLIGRRTQGDGAASRARSSAQDQRAPAPGPQPPPASTREYLGVVLARSSADIAPRFQGRLKEVAVRLGDHVTAGSVIAVVDAPTLRSDLRVADAALNTASIELALMAVELSEAEERLTRSTALSVAALSSGEELATARYQRQRTATRVEAARAQLAERQAQVDRLRKDNEDTVVRAPFDGVVAARYVDPGATVSASTPIVRIISARDFILRFAVPEDQIAAVSIGIRVHAQIRDHEQILHGIVDKLAPEIDTASRMVFVEARVQAIESGGSTVSGETVHVVLDPTP